MLSRPSIRAMEATDHRTVFITNMAGDHSYTPAARYGAIRPVTSGNYPVFKTARLVEEIAAALASSSEEDFLLFSGSSFIAGLCLAMWLARHKKCRALLYDRPQGGYVPRTIDRSELEVQMEKAADRLEAR